MTEWEKFKAHTQQKVAKNTLHQLYKSSRLFTQARLVSEEMHII